MARQEHFEGIEHGVPELDALLEEAALASARVKAIRQEVKAIMLGLNEKHYSHDGFEVVIADREVIRLKAPIQRPEVEAA